MGPDYNHNHNHNRPGRREEKHSGTRYCIELPLLLIRGGVRAALLQARIQESLPSRHCCRSGPSLTMQLLVPLSLLLLHPPSMLRRSSCGGLVRSRLRPLRMDEDSSGAEIKAAELPEALAPVGETLRCLRCESVSTVPIDLAAPPQLAPIDAGSTFVEVFRTCTPYIKMHQGNVMVIHISSDCLEDATLFDQLMEEIAVLALLGVKPVLLVGVHVQIDDGLRARGLPMCAFHKGVRETTLQTMRVVQEVNGFMRSRVEGALARGRARLGPGGSVGVDVVGGNFFYTAQPVGVRNGVDYGFTGEVRNVDVDKIKQHLEAGEIVLLTGLGYSASGTVFNVRTEQLAASAAAALGASKIMYLTTQRLVEEQSTHGATGTGGKTVVQPLQSMRLAEVRQLVAYRQGCRHPNPNPNPNPNPGASACRIRAECSRLRGHFLSKATRAAACGGDRRRNRRRDRRGSISCGGR